MDIRFLGHACFELSDGEGMQPEMVIPPLQ